MSLKSGAMGASNLPAREMLGPSLCNARMPEAAPTIRRAGRAMASSTTIEAWTMRPCFGLLKRACRRSCRRIPGLGRRRRARPDGIGGTEVQTPTARSRGTKSGKPSATSRWRAGRRTKGACSSLARRTRSPRARSLCHGDQRNLPRNHDGNRTAIGSIPGTRLGSRRL